MTPSIARRVSLRFSSNPPEEPTTTLVLNSGAASHLYTDFRPLTADPAVCDWAFCGTKTHLPDGRCQWSHVVDSRRDGDDNDIATCQTLPNGDERETGHMRNPATGHVEPYEEVWRNEPVPDGAHVLALVLARPGDTPRGVFVRVGSWAQGVVHGAACRWHFEGHRWRQVAAYGDGPMPVPTGTSLAATVVHTPAWVVVDDYVWHPAAAAVPSM